jgi:hypothetical protein
MVIVNDQQRKPYFLAQVTISLITFYGLSL